MSNFQINTTLKPGDEGKQFATTEFGRDGDQPIQVLVYESLVMPGVLIVEVLTVDEDRAVKVYINEDVTFDNTEHDDGGSTSASRQHMIDTGRYLTLTEIAAGRASGDISG